VEVEVEVEVERWRGVEVERWITQYNILIGQRIIGS
jgi:hypothetical protein